MALPALDKIDPAEAWQPWRPTTADPWTRKWAAHLYRRAGFGASREEIGEAARRGPDATLELLLRGQPGSADLETTFADAGRIASARDDGGAQLRVWWLYCMLQGGHPLREKLTLFWHNHFATSIAKVHSPALMFRQNLVLREHALGKFGPFLQAMSRDPAMLIWLDSNSNVKGKPNENYAREVMELFSLGVGNYTEKDIREAARAFTGWHTSGKGFDFKPDLHDNGVKTVLGRTGKWDGGDVVEIILTQPAAARFLVANLYSFFVSEIAPPAALLEPLCKTFRESNYDVANLMKTILSSRLFYSEHAFRKRIKCPVEYVLGAVLAIYRRYPERDENYRPLVQSRLQRWLTGMGQTLFAPPNVKGWPGGKTWLNTSTVLERDNFAAAVATGGLLWWDSQVGFTPAGEFPPPKAFDSARIIEEESVESPEDVVRVLLDAYVPGGVRQEAREKFTAFVAEGKPAGAELARRVREVVHAILTMPEYQLA
ncbi:MAG TPA: DUF1800 domain-containing protein [Gemmata sp.]|nr:DUF1800 domain-containing protein [Gemmata sp.]